MLLSPSGLGARDMRHAGYWRGPEAKEGEVNLFLSYFINHACSSLWNTWSGERHRLCRTGPGGHSRGERLKVEGQPELGDPGQGEP
jgi:hypothetical protein